MTAIIGAGLSGLIAATQLPTAHIHEANDREALSHKAVLRFRSSILSDLTGIPFRKVTVRKSIYYDGHTMPSIDMANAYSYKTNGMYHERSIWNIEPVTRFIAPEDLTEQLVHIVGESRISWNDPIQPRDLEVMGGREPIISTLPMPIMLKMITPERVTILDTPEFKHASIEVDRFRVEGADVFQTIYYPHPGMATYRASITGDLLIIERIGELKQGEVALICNSFGINIHDITPIEYGHRQRFGKITPIPEQWRKQFILNATIQRNIYSLGRFATWRNILLDDVVHDIAVIKRIIASGAYGAVLQHSGVSA